MGEIKPVSRCNLRGHVSGRLEDREFGLRPGRLYISGSNEHPAEEDKGAGEEGDDETDSKA